MGNEGVGRGVACRQGVWHVGGEGWHIGWEGCGT